MNLAVELKQHQIKTTRLQSAPLDVIASKTMCVKLLLFLKMAKLQDMRN